MIIFQLTDLIRLTKSYIHSMEGFNFINYKIYSEGSQMSKFKFVSDKNQKKHHNLIWKILFVILVLFLITGCNSKNKKSAVEMNASSAVEQESYQITLWQGGGFTGLTSGFTLSSTGEVIHWQRFPGQPDSILWKGTRSQVEIQKLKSQLEQSGALKLKADETGNMTAGVSYKMNETVYRWTWKKIGSDDDIPELIRDWFKDALNFCQSLQSKN